MSFEIAWSFLIPCLTALLLLICMSIFIKNNIYLRILMIIVASVTLPAFVPGHGEIKGLLPNCALLGVPYTPPKVISLFFIQLYLGILGMVFYKLKLLRFKPKNG